MYTCIHITYPHISINIQHVPSLFLPLSLGGSVTCYILPCQKGQQRGSAPPAPSGGPEDKILDLRLDLYYKQFERDKVINSGHFPEALHASATGRT